MPNAGKHNMPDASLEGYDGPFYSKYTVELSTAFEMVGGFSQDVVLAAAKEVTNRVKEVKPDSNIVTSDGYKYYGVVSFDLSWLGENKFWEPEVKILIPKRDFGTGPSPRLDRSVAVYTKGNVPEATVHAICGKFSETLVLCYLRKYLDRPVNKE